MLIGNREWVAVDTVAGSELSLEIASPEIIGRRNDEMRTPRMSVLPILSPRRNESFSFEDCGNGTSCRLLEIGKALEQHTEDLLRAPSWMLHSEFDD